MTPSLSEITATGRKAAKGAGYSWGMADEAGRATAWLWAHGIDSITALADLLDQGSPETCPIHIGTAVCDAPPTQTIYFERVHSPILLLSFAAELGKITKSTVKMTIDDGVYYATPDKMFVEHDHQTGSVTLTRYSDEPSGTPLTRHPRRAAPVAWDRLGVWEHKTYAPATEASRLAGAGAGLSDND
jgi:hypothetical protein